MIDIGTATETETAATGIKITERAGTVTETDTVTDTAMIDTGTGTTIEGALAERGTRGKVQAGVEVESARDNENELHYYSSKSFTYSHCPFPISSSNSCPNSRVSSGDALPCVVARNLDASSGLPLA